MKVITFMVLIAFFLMFLFFINGCVKDNIEWEKTDNLWRATNMTCLEEKHIDYLCIDNCYEETTDIWQFCQDKGTIKQTNTGIDVLCFPQSCIPQIIEGECIVVCPL